MQTDKPEKTKAPILPETKKTATTPADKSADTTGSCCCGNTIKKDKDSCC